MALDGSHTAVAKHKRSVVSCDCLPQKEMDCEALYAPTAVCGAIFQSLQSNAGLGSVLALVDLVTSCRRVTVDLGKAAEAVE